MESRAWEYLVRLCRHPHRGSAGPGEAAAAADLAAWLEAMGYQVERQRFRAPRDTLYLGPPLVMGGMLTAVLLGRLYPAAGLLLALLLLVPLVGEMLGSLHVDLDLLLRPRHHSANLVARAPHRRPSARQIIICAHYDTQRASYLFHPAFRRFIQPFFYLVYGSLGLVVMGLLLQTVAPGAPWVPGLLLTGCGLLAISGLFLLHCRVTGRYIQGANDNGSGAALLLALAEHFAAVQPQEAELTFLLTGAEEVGTRGMKHFMRCTQVERERTLFINLDNLGAGQFHYLTGEGMLRVYPYCHRLVRAAALVGEEYPGRVTPRPNLLLPTDGLIPLVQGYRTITFIAMDAGGQLPDYHWYTDTYDRIDRELLALEQAYLTAYVNRLAQTG